MPEVPRVIAMTGGVELTMDDGSKQLLRSHTDLESVTAVREWNITVDLLTLRVFAGKRVATIPESDPGFDALLQWLFSNIAGAAARWEKFYRGISFSKGNSADLLSSSYSELDD